MNNFSKLIKAHMISFKEAMLNNYKAIGLDEIDMVIIMHLHEQTKHRDDYLSIVELCKMMTLSENSISKRVVKLVERGFIDLKIEATGEEQFSIEPTIEKLGEILAKNDDEHHDNSKEQDLIEIVAYIEKMYQRSLKPSDLDLVNHWLDENVEKEVIYYAVSESMKAKKTHLKYADAIIVSKQNHLSRKKGTIDPEIKEMLESINVRRTY